MATPRHKKLNQPRHPIGKHMLEYTKKLRVDFKPADNLSQEEKALFTTLSDYVNHYISAVKQINDRGRINFTIMHEQDTIAKFQIGGTLENSMGALGTYPYLIELQKKIREDLTRGAISEETASGVEKFVGSLLDLSQTTSNLRTLASDTTQAKMALDELKDTPTKKLHLWQLDPIENTREVIRKEAMSEEARKYALDLLKTHETEIKRIETMSVILKRQNFMGYWCDGKFDHKIPAIISEDDEKKLTLSIVQGLKTFFSSGDKYHAENTDGKIDKLIEAATKNFIVRLKAYEAPILAKYKEQEARRQAALEEKNKSATVENKPTPHHQEVINKESETAYGMPVDTIQMLVALSRTATSGAAIAPAAAKLSGLIDRLWNGIDSNDQAVHQLADLLFSRSNIMWSAKALGTEGPIKHLVSNGTHVQWEKNAKQLRSLYSSSPAVAQLINRLLENKEEILLLATLVRSEERCHAYGQFLLSLGKDISTDKAEKIHAALAGEIRQILQGKKVAEVASAEIPFDKTLQISESWQKLMGSEFRAETIDENHLRIVSTRYPDMSTTVKPKLSDEDFASELKQLRSECVYHDTNLELIKHLCRTCGFDLVRDGDVSRIMHREYAINIELTGSELEQMTILADAQERFNSRQSDQKFLLDEAIKAGLIVSRVGADSKAIMLQPAEGPAITFAPRGYLTADEFERVQLMMEGVPPKVGAATIRKDPEPVEAKTPVIQVDFDPPAGQHMIVLDAGFFKRLIAPRPNGETPDGTWLDLLKQTAALPNVTIIVPAIVADWELRGKIPKYDEQAKRIGFKRIDPRFNTDGNYLQKIARPVSKFLASASRGAIDKDGHVTIEPGENPKIIIMDTPEDRELYERIRALDALPEQQRVNKIRAKFNHQGFGDDAITRIINQMRYEVPFTIVSDDIGYLNIAPFTSTQGLAVNHMTTGAYINAELENRESSLRAALGETQPITRKRIFEESSAFLNESVPTEIFKWEIKGNNAPDYPGKSYRLSEVIAKSLQKMSTPEAPGQNGHADGHDTHEANGRWASRHPTPDRPNRRGITPGEVHQPGKNGHSPNL